MSVSLIDGHIDEQRKERPYDISPEPLWCEDCKHFCNADMGGEGECDIDNHDTWYGCPICEKAELKCGEVKKPTNYDRIRNMSLKEMAKFLAEQVMQQEHLHLIKENPDITATHIEFLKQTLFRGYLRYLESEVTE